MKDVAAIEENKQVRDIVPTEENKVVRDVVPAVLAKEDNEEVQIQSKNEYEETKVRTIQKTKQTISEFKFYCKPCDSGFHFKGAYEKHRRTKECKTNWKNERALHEQQLVIARNAKKENDIIEMAKIFKQ